MKNTLIFILAVTFLSCTLRIRQAPPVQVVEVVPAAPSQAHIWVPGYYGYRGNRYVWVPGSYRIPPRGRTTWVSGSYIQNGNGNHRFRRGYWR